MFIETTPGKVQPTTLGKTFLKTYLKGIYELVGSDNTEQIHR